MKLCQNERIQLSLEEELENGGKKMDLVKKMQNEKQEFINKIAGRL